MMEALSVTHVLLILQPLDNVTGFTVSGTTLLASKDARKAWEKGTAALQKNHLTEAEKDFRRAVELYPKYAVAWYDLGRVLLKTKRPDEARKALEAAAAADPKYINPYPVLAQIALDQRQWEDLARHTATVIKLNPFFSENIYLFSAQANLVLQNFDLAETHAREAIRMDLEHRYPMALRILARILVRKGNAQGAIEQLQAYLLVAPPGPDADSVRNEIAGLQQQVSLLH